jgi:hypothetical protein
MRPRIFLFWVGQRPSPDRGNLPALRRRDRGYVRVWNFPHQRRSTGCSRARVAKGKSTQLFFYIFRLAVDRDRGADIAEVVLRLRPPR